MLVWLEGRSQNIYINEIQASNISTLYDYTGDTPDWLEIYNAGPDAINLKDFGLSDVDSLPLKWTFPAHILLPDSHVLVHASSRDQKEEVLFWETLFDVGDEWRYLVPNAEPQNPWRNNGFDDSNWSSGKSGFGYGDDDDSTIVQSTMSIFLRKEFIIIDKQEIGEAFLHIDFDDAFVAYINGVEVARSNIGQPGVIPNFDDPANNYNHEAKLYSGGTADEFAIKNIGDVLIDGENILAIEVHNHSLTSSDLSAIPIFSIGHRIKSQELKAISSFINLVPVGLHANFKISSVGEHIILSDPDGLQLDSVYSGDIPSNVSMGRNPDGMNEWSFFLEPTPGDFNLTESFSTESLSEVYFSNQGGFYPNAISISLSTNNSQDSIYYSLNGGEPTKEDFLFISEIMINKSVTIRSRVIKEGVLPGGINTQTYILGDVHDLPVLCINTNPKNLWDEEYGIYVKGSNAESEFPYMGANFWQDWERPANVAMYEADGSLAFQLDAGIKIFGAWSRGMDQKSISIHCGKSYGTESIKYKIFPNRNIEEYETIILRNSGNDFNNTMLRDAYAGQVVKSLGLDQQAYRPAVLYLNGEYWGIQNIREKINEEFLAVHHGIDEESISILERNGEVVKGNSEHYMALLSYLNTHSLSDNDRYKYAGSQIDIANFIKYNISQIFIDNRDWPGNNVKFWREDSDYAKWRWILFDLDFAFNTWASDNQSFNTLEHALEANGPGWPNPPWSTFVLRKLMENESFRHNFINCFADNLNTIFSPKLLEDQLDNMQNGISQEINNHLQRWNGNKENWNDRMDAMRSFVNERRRYVRNHIKTTLKLSGTYNLNVNIKGSGSVNLNTIHLSDQNWQGVYYDYIPVVMKAEPDPGFRFVEWVGINSAYKEELKVTSVSDTSFTAVFSPIEAGQVNLVINEINYNSIESQNSGDWIELLNASEFAVNLSGWRIKDDNDENEYIIPEGTIIERHGYLVICRDNELFINIYPDIHVVEKELEYGLSSGGDCIRLFTKDGILSDEVCYENSAPWPTEPNGGGKTLSLYDALSNNAHPANWLSSSGYGTPGHLNDIITGIDHEVNKNQSSTTVYPNPIRNEGFISFTNLQDAFLEIRLLDLSGRQHGRAQAIDIQNEQNYIPINLEYFNVELGNGIYLLQIETGSNLIFKKIIVSR